MLGYRQAPTDHRQDGQCVSADLSILTILTVFPARQLAELGRRHARVIGWELPGQPDLRQMAVRVSQSRAGLACASQLA